MADNKTATPTADTRRKTVTRTVIFRPPYTKKDGSVPNIAAADMLGCFGSIPMAVKDFGLKLNRDNTITVYMPSGMYGADRVGPIGGSIASDADVAAEATTMQPDEAKAFIARHRAKKAHVEALAQAVRDAWSSFPVGTDNADKFGKPVAVELPE